MLATTAPTSDMVLLVNRHGETVRVGDHRVLVASKTVAGRWYDVSAGICQCPGFQFRGRCRHLAANPGRTDPPPPPSATSLPSPVAREPMLDAPAASATRVTPPPTSCPRCQRPVTTAADGNLIARRGECGRCLDELLYGPEVA